MSLERKSGMVLSGGGADGAFAVGVLKALAAGRSPTTAGRPFDPLVFAGTSIGAFNAAFLASRWDISGSSAVGELEQAWLDRLAEDANGCGNGAFRIRNDPRTLLNPLCYLPNPLPRLATTASDGAYLSWDFLQRLVHLTTGEDSLLQRATELFDFSALVSSVPWHQSLARLIDYPALRASQRKLRIASTNWATGQLETFRNRDMSDSLGPLAIAASSAVPGFYPPVQVGSQPFVDGGVLLNTPLRPAIRAGATVLHVIFLDPDVAKIPLAHLGNTLDTLYRMQQIAWAAKMEADFQSARRINEIKGLLQSRLEDPAETFPELAERYGRYTQLEIHRYSPGQDYGGAIGFLDLERDRLERLVAGGFEAAQNHDCAVCGCVLPVVSPEPGPPREGPDCVDGTAEVIEPRELGWAGLADPQNPST